LKFFIHLIAILLFWQLRVSAQYLPSDYTTRARALVQFNDGYQNINPYVSEDGSRLWLTKIGHPSNKGKIQDQDIWCALREKGEWTQPGNMLSGLNTELNDLIVGQTNGQYIYVMQYRHGVDEHLSVINAYARKGEAYELHHKVIIPNIKFLSEFFGFYIAKDESYVIISMKGEYAFGKEDLYVIQRQTSGWSEPIHLGARINSVGFEMSPFMSNDGKHLFFASEGHGSYGSADIFVASRMDDTWQNWSKPMNLGPNINSDRFDAYFSLAYDQDEAYFISNKDGMIGSLYQIKYRRNDDDRVVSAHPAASGFIRLERLPAMNIQLNLLDENDQVIQSVTTNDEGYFNLQSFLPDRDYKIAIEDSIKQDLRAADIFLANDLGEKMVFMNEGGLGIFGFKVLSGQKIEEVNELERLARQGNVVDHPTTISGKVATYGTVREKLKLNVIDENSKVIEQIETDDQGYFTFSTRSNEKSYFLSVDENLKGLVDVYEIFLTNDNPNQDIVVTKTAKHLFEFRTLSDGSNEGIARMSERDRMMPRSVFDKYGYEPARTNEAIAGYLKLDRLPLINTEISLIDENDHVLGMAKTDGDGKFVFEDVLPEGDYSLQLNSEQEAELDKSEIYLARNPQDVIFYMNDGRSGVFAFKKLAQSRPMTLYSLRSETESGFIVQEQEAKLKGRFEYKKLPKSGVRLKLMDERENIIQITEVNENGEFEFENYIVNENYFISVENSSGLADIFEIYLSGEHKNVLVNNTNKFVFAFTVLPSQDILLKQAYEPDTRLSEELSVGPRFDSEPRGGMESYYEFDLSMLESSNYISLKRILKDVEDGYTVTLRLSNEERSGEEVVLLPIREADSQLVVDYLIDQGIKPDRIENRMNASDQVLITIH
jgi:hypothetical protein